MTFEQFLKKKRVYRKWIRNADGQHGKGWGRKILKDYPKQAAGGGFFWDRSPEDHQYWCDIKNEFFKEEEK